VLLPGGPAEKPALLYHFSEDPTLTLFEPRAGRAIPGRPEGERLVWAIDDRHAPMYFFPLDCPRIILWAYADSTPEDVARWIGPDAPRMVAHIEAAWLDRVRASRLYRYSFDVSPFETIHDHGTHVSPLAVSPVAVEPVGDLELALTAATVPLRVLDVLQPLAEAWGSSLHFSAIRMRNAIAWTPPA